MHQRIFETEEAIAVDKHIPGSESLEMAAANQDWTKHEKQALAPQRNDGQNDSSSANHSNTSMDPLTAWLFSGDQAALREGATSLPSEMERNQGRETGSSFVADTRMQDADFSQIHSAPSIFSEVYKPGDFPTVNSGMNFTTSSAVSVAVGKGHFDEKSDDQSAVQKDQENQRLQRGAQRESKDHDFDYAHPSHRTRIEVDDARK